MIARKGKKKNSLSDKFLIVLLVCFNFIILGFLVIANARLYSQTGEARHQYMNLNKEIRELEMKNDELEELLTLTTDEAEIEKLLREKGLYKKPGEEVIVIKRDEVEEEIIEPQSASVWDKIGGFFRRMFGRD